MDISDNIKRFAKKYKFPSVKYLGRWNDYDVYNAYDPDFPYIGLPQYILQNGDSISWANPEQTEELIAAKL